MSIFYRPIEGRKSGSKPVFTVINLVVVDLMRCTFCINCVKSSITVDKICEKFN